MASSHFLFFVAVHALCIKEEKVLLLKRQNTGYRDGFYGVPSGHVDGGETIAAAMSREINEEVGLTIDPTSLQPAHVMHRIVSQTEERIDYFYIVREWSGTERNTEPQKCSQLRWVSIMELPAETIPYIKLGLERSLAAKHFSEHRGD